MAGAATPAQIAAFGVSMKMKCPTAAEVRELADTMLGYAQRVPTEVIGTETVDVVGTGGDRSNTVNLSTMAAIVVAAAGVPVVKHGNRAASSKSGGADMLEALGVRIDLGPEEVARCVAEVGIGFCFAPVFHPSFKYAGPPRREIGVPTVFNLLGPLVNPLRPESHVLGVARPDLLDPMAEALLRLDQGRAVVVHGHGGLDEATLSGPSELRVLENGHLRREVLDPWALGLEPAPMEAICGGGLAENRAILEAVLQGGGTAPQRDVVALNSALVLWVAGRAGSVAEGVAQAREALAQGLPWQRLNGLATFLRGDGADASQDGSVAAG